MVIAATNKEDSIDGALRRAGRFDREIGMGIPNLKERLAILKNLSMKIRITENWGEAEWDELAKGTPGYVGADLSALIQEAALAAARRCFESTEGMGDLMALVSKSTKALCDKDGDVAMKDAGKDSGAGADSDREAGASGEEATAADADETASEKAREAELMEPAAPATETVGKSESEAKPKPNAEMPENFSVLRTFDEEQLKMVKVEMPDFRSAMDTVQPSCLREGFSGRPDTSFEQVGGCKSLIEELTFAIIEPIRNADLFAKFNL